jgi:hypothetical protein
MTGIYKVQASLVQQPIFMKLLRYAKALHRYEPRTDGSIDLRKWKFSTPLTIHSDPVAFGRFNLIYFHSLNIKDENSYYENCLLVIVSETITRDSTLGSSKQDVLDELLLTFWSCYVDFLLSLAHRKVFSNRSCLLEQRKYRVAR